MSGRSVIGTAAFVVDSSGTRCAEIEKAPHVRGASVVKPLLFWVGASAEPFASDIAAWEAIAEPAVTVSDNEATAALWSRVGEDRLLSEIEERAGVGWCVAGDGEHPALRLMVTAGELAGAYAAFASDDSHQAGVLRGWMRDVPTAQTFGVRSVAREATGAAERSIGVKCGWFGLERAHAVVLVDLPDRTLGSAVTTARRVDPTTRARAQELSGDMSALAVAHEAISGESVRSATRRALEFAARL